MTSYNYKEPNPQDSERTMSGVKDFITHLKDKVHNAVIKNGATTKQPLQKAQNQNG